MQARRPKVLQHTTIPVLVLAVESNRPARNSCATGDHPRRTPLARGGHPRARIAGRARRASRDDRHVSLLRAMPITSGISRCAASSEGRRVPVPQIARAHSEFNDTLDELQRQHVAGHELRRRSWREHRRLRGGSAGRPRRVRRRRSSASRRRSCSTWCWKQGDHPGRAKVPHCRGLGGNRRRFRRQRRSRASRRTTTRSSASCSCES